MSVFRQAETVFGSQRAVAREIGKRIGCEIPARTYRDWSTRTPKYKSTDALVRYVLRDILCDCAEGSSCDVGGTGE